MRDFTSALKRLYAEPPKSLTEAAAEAIKGEIDSLQHRSIKALFQCFDKKRTEILQSWDKLDYNDEAGMDIDEPVAGPSGTHFSSTADQVLGEDIHAWKAQHSAFATRPKRRGRGRSRDVC